MALEIQTLNEQNKKQNRRVMDLCWKERGWIMLVIVPQLLPNRSFAASTSSKRRTKNSKRIYADFRKL